MLLAAAFALAADDEAKQFIKSWKQAESKSGAEKIKAFEDALSFAATHPSFDMARAVVDVSVKGGKFDLDGVVYGAMYDSLAVMGKKPEIAAEFVAQLSKSKHWEIRAIMARLLGEYPDMKERTLGPLHEAMNDKQWQVAAATIYSLRKIRDASSVPVLADALVKSKGGRMSAELAAALRDLTGEAFDTAEDWYKWTQENRGKISIRQGSALTPEEDSQQPYTADVTRKRELTTTAQNPLYGTVTSHKVIFIVDISNSMNVKGPWGNSGVLSRIDIVKKELAAVIKDQLTEESQFNIITFHDEVYPWKPRLIPATGENKDGAVRFIFAQKADKHTNTMGVLESALADKDVDTIYFLSDGTPTVGSTLDHNEILKRVRGLNTMRNILIHSLAFMVGDASAMKVTEDKSAALKFMQDLARENGGYFKKFE
jgi:hypothetical protein